MGIRLSPLTQGVEGCPAQDRKVGLGDLGVADPGERRANGVDVEVDSQARHPEVVANPIGDRNAPNHPLDLHRDPTERLQIVAGDPDLDRIGEQLPDPSSGRRPQSSSCSPSTWSRKVALVGCPPGLT
jgi:hypothetical protein